MIEVRLEGRSLHDQVDRFQRLNCLGRSPKGAGYGSPGRLALGEGISLVTKPQRGGLGQSVD